MCFIFHAKLVAKLFKFASKYLDLTSTNIGDKKELVQSFETSTLAWHVGSITMFFLYKWVLSELHSGLIHVRRIGPVHVPAL